MALLALACNLEMLVKYRRVIASIAIQVGRSMPIPRIRTTFAYSRSTAGLHWRQHLDGDMRQRGKAPQRLAIEIRRTGLTRNDRQDRAEMARAQPPKMQIGDPVTLRFY